MTLGEETERCAVQKKKTMSAAFRKLEGAKKGVSSRAFKEGMWSCQHTGPASRTMSGVNKLLFIM